MTWTLIAVIFASDALACHFVDGPRILGRDVSAANPNFAALDSDLVVGATPLPGVQRVFHADELVRLARRNGLTLPTLPGETCFERLTESLSAEQLLPALRTALASEGVEISILDFSRYGVPRGTLEFTPAGLSATGYWRGHVAYDGNRTMPVWAMVSVTSERTWVEASQALVSNRVIGAGQLVLRKGLRFPFGPAALTSIDAAAGRLPIRAIKPGEPIFASMLMAAHEVERGDRVSVEVISGEARLSFDAAAETAGRLGELVLVRNPESGKPFQARVEGKDRVAIRK